MNRRLSWAPSGILAAVALCGCMLMSNQANSSPTEKTTPPAQKPANAKELVLGAGCFWCVEAIFEDLIGVSSVESGYAGGENPNPTYEEVCSGQTGHAEVIKITYDPKLITADDLLHIFFTVHDPTTLNRQGGDSGTQYRSVVFYADPETKALAEKVKADIEREKIWRDPIVTTLEPLKNYATAEAYHQNYFEKFEKAGTMERMKMNSGYCSVVIEPKVRKFREKYAAKLRKKS